MAARLDIETIQKAYERYSKFYNASFGWFVHPGRQKAVQLVSEKPGSRILEVGVGTGLSLPIYPPSVTVVGIDISPAMLTRAKKLVVDKGLRNVEKLEIMNAEEMTFPDDSFDSVVAMYVASVVPSPAKFVKELKRVCKPGGRIIILNYFQKPEKMSGKVLSRLVFLSKYTGFHLDFTLHQFIKDTDIKVIQQVAVNLFDVWTILVCENDK